MASILVLNAESNIALAAIRSFGRRGFSVVAIASSKNALSLRSRYATWGYLVPWNREKASEYFEAVFKLARRHACRALVTVSETMMRVLSQSPALTPPGLVCCFPPGEVIQRAMDKAQVLEAARTVGLVTPETIAIQNGAQLTHELDHLNYPVVLKFASVGPRPLGAEWGFKCRLADRQELHRLAATLPELAVPLLVQEYARGRYESLGMAYDRRGEPHIFQWAALREYEAGLGSFRLSVSPRPGLADKCRALLDHLGYSGVAEVEFRHDIKTDQYQLMEINPRLWGGVAFPIACGVDFPWLSYLIATKQPLPPPARYPAGRYSRNLSGDAQWLWHALRGNYACSHPNMRVGRLPALLKFLSSLPKRTVFDQESWDDLGPFWFTVTSRLKRVAEHMVPGRAPQLIEQT